MAISYIYSNQFECFSAFLQRHGYKECFGSLYINSLYVSYKFLFSLKVNLFIFHMSIFLFTFFQLLLLKDLFLTALLLISLLFKTDSISSIKSDLFFLSSLDQIKFFLSFIVTAITSENVFIYI